MKLDTRKNTITLDSRDRRDFTNGCKFVAAVLRVADTTTTLYKAAKEADEAMARLAVLLPKDE